MRLKNIVLTGLINDRLIAYEELERAINTKDSIHNACEKVKHYLKKIVKLNAMITEWQEIMRLDTNTSIDELTDKLKKEKDE